MEDKRGFFGQIFTSLMIFSLAVGASTVAFIYSWPWEKANPEWKPNFRLVALCGEKKEACGISYGELDEAKAKGQISLEMTEAAGEFEEPLNWLKWSRNDGVYEVKASSWHFQTSIRYKVEKDAPVLVAVQDVDVAKAFTYGMGAAMFLVIGLNLRRLRR
jgi:hypothetical protein